MALSGSSSSPGRRHRPDHVSAAGADRGLGRARQFSARHLHRGRNLAGGIALLLPPQPVDAEIAERVLDGLDGLVITGGKDVDPAHLRSAAASGDRRTRAATATRWEFALLDGALRRGMPVLGICRGAQVLNVALGGTLHQHLPDVVGHTRHQQGNAVFSTSAVRTVPGTRLAALIGESSDAQCYHHQAIDRPRCGSDRQRPGFGRRHRGGRSPWGATSFWRCSGIPRSGWTICGCSRRWSRPRPRMRPGRVERMTAQRL